MTNYRIWHISNPPNKGFTQEVGSPADAVPLLKMLAMYDLYLDDLIIANAQGLEVRTDAGEWEEWGDETGRDINEIRLS